MLSPLGIVTRVMNAIGAGLVLLVMVVILADVLGRFLLNSPLRGTPEIVAMSIVAIVYLQFPSTLRAGRVICTDGFVGWLKVRSVRLQQFVEAGHHAVGAAMFAVVAIYVGGFVPTLLAGGDYYGTPGSFAFPKWPIYAVVTFGCSVMAVQYLALVVQLVAAGLEGRQLLDIDPATKVLS